MDVNSPLKLGFFDRLCDAVNRLRVGYGLDPRSTLAPVSNEQPFRFIEGLIEGTRQSGAEVVELGQKVDPDNWGNGYYLRPAVVRHVAPDAEIVVSAQFGPIIPLVPYDSEEQALQSLGDRHLPFGGIKQSGIGRNRTTIGLAEYIEYHAISLNKTNLTDNKGKHQDGTGRTTTLYRVRCAADGSAGSRRRLYFRQSRQRPCGHHREPGQGRRQRHADAEGGAMPA